LLLNIKTVWISIWVQVTIKSMIHFAMAWRVCDENCILCLRFPVLFEGLLKGTSNVLWSIIVADAPQWG
jgi:hypothetical protein